MSNNMTSQKYSTILAIIIITSVLLLHTQIPIYQSDLIRSPKPVFNNFINVIKNYTILSLNSSSNSRLDYFNSNSSISRLSALGNIIKENVGSIINKLTPGHITSEDEEENAPPKKVILFGVHGFTLTGL
ncbi:unnamed protein product [Meganyctiphanes norvegica]|uniref:Uncharacterized protein n=1 Tax=Meganyctiphanes norvegica TaxID=48144 RepID=A0AAV2Q678_MEGNR